MRNPVISKDAYRAFINILFGAALTLWVVTFLFFKNPLLGNPFEHTFPEAGGSRPLNIWAAGILYGAVLVCTYWIFTMRIAQDYRPTHLLILALDFIALSFMTGAAVSWPHVAIFNKLALTTILLLWVRFALAARTEYRTKFPTGHPCLRDWEMLHYCCVYAVCALVLSGMFISGRLGAVFESASLYYIIIGGMLLGTALTWWHSKRGLAEAEERPPRYTWEVSDVPILVPDYSAVKHGRLGEVANDVFQGERVFRRLLAQNYPPAHYHNSRVHTYRDVEVQAFIMAHHAARSNERQVRSMWVYLSHWLDDFFDTWHAVRLANMAIYDERFAIEDILGQLDHPLHRLWEAAVNETRSWLDSATWNERLFQIGMRRLMASGPLFSARCEGKHKELRAQHKEFVLKSMEKESGAKRIIAELDPIWLAYTTKVVVEIWDSFAPEGRFEASMLMNCFYAPGLLFHDARAEGEQGGEVPVSLTHDEVETALRKAATQIQALNEAEIKLAMKPVPMFITTFKKVLDKELLLPFYTQFVHDPEIKEFLPG